MSKYRMMIVLGPNGFVSGGLGRAATVAVADAEAIYVHSWEEIAVGWDAAHDTQAEGSHHGNMVRFMQDHGIQIVIAGHVGEGMRVVLEKMGITFVGAPSMPGKTAAMEAARLLDEQSTAPANP